MWPDFIPIEYHGMSVITAMIVFMLIIVIVHLWTRTSCLQEMVQEVKISLAKQEAYQKAQYEDIKEIKDILRRGNSDGFG